MCYLDVVFTIIYLINFTSLILTLVANLAWLNKSYQMNPANYREALLEMREDESEGADILLVGFVCVCVCMFMVIHLTLIFMYTIFIFKL